MDLFRFIFNLVVLVIFIFSRYCGKLGLNFEVVFIMCGFLFSFFINVLVILVNFVKLFVVLFCK